MTGWTPGETARDLLDVFRIPPADLTYTGLRDISLGALSSAVSDWNTLVGKLETLREDARRDLLGASLTPGWRGETATAGREAVLRTSRRFEYAHEQAEAVHSVLSTLLGDLMDYRSALRGLAEEATSQELTIDSSGTVRWPEQPNYTAEGPPVGLTVQGVPLDVHQAMADLQIRVRDTLAAATETDAVAARALADIMASDTGAFTGSPHDSLADAHETYAREAASAYLDVAGKPPEEWTEADLAQMDRLLEEYGQHPEFAEQVIDTLGMDAFLRLSQQLDDTANVRLNEANIPLDNIQRGMGNTLATAMQPPGDMATQPPHSPAFQSWLQTPDGQRYQARLDDLHRVGATELYGDKYDGLNRIYNDSRLGYDVVNDLLEAADQPVDDQFYNQLLTGMIEAERQNPAVWDSERYPPTDDGFSPKNDPVDRLLDIGARSNPDAVTSFFDPSPNGPGANAEFYTNSDKSFDYLNYFIGEGDGTRTLIWTEPHTLPVTEIESPGLLTAIEVAATGIPATGPPDPELTGHSDTNIAIAEEVWNTFAQKSERVTEGPNDFTLTLGHIASEHMGDIHNAIGDNDRGHFPIERRATFDPEHTQMLLEQLGHNREVYERITVANQAQLRLTVEAFFEHDWENTENRTLSLHDSVHDAGQVAGTMSYANASRMYVEQFALDEIHNESVDNIAQWTERALSAGGELLGGIPGGGVIADGLTNEIVGSIEDRFDEDNSMEAAKDSERDYNSSRHSFVNSVGTTLESSYERSSDTPEEDMRAQISNLQTSAQNGFSQGAGISVSQ